jgi:hypothetical protein
MSGRQPAESRAAKGSLKDGPRFESPLAYRWTRQLPFLSHISGSYRHATATTVRFLFTRHWRTQPQASARAIHSIGPMQTHSSQPVPVPARFVGTIPSPQRRQPAILSNRKPASPADAV